MTGSPFRLPEGSRIGPYTLQRVLGEGGMGEVWEAQQSEPVQRTVALKVLKPGMDSRQVVARLPGTASSLNGVLRNLAALHRTTGQPAAADSVAGRMVEEG